MRIVCRAIITNFIAGGKHYSRGFWEGGKPETLFPWGESGRIIYRGVWRQEIQNVIGGDEIITRGLARGENLTLYFHGKNH